MVSWAMIYHLKEEGGTDITVQAGQVNDRLFFLPAVVLCAAGLHLLDRPHGHKPVATVMLLTALLARAKEKMM